MFIALLLNWNLMGWSLSICPTGEVKKDELMGKSAKQRVLFLHACKRNVIRACFVSFYEKALRVLHQIHRT